MTTDPKPEQLKALADKLEQVYIISASESDTKQQAARHLRAYAEQMAQESKHIITCVYCGQAYPENTPTHGADVAVLTEHIKVCEKHPMRALQSQLAQRDARIKELECSLKKYDDELSGAASGATYDLLKRQQDRIKELEALCAKKDKVIGDVQFFLKDYLRSVTHPGVSRLVGDCYDALSTDCGKDLLAQHEAWRKALVEIASFKEGPEVTSNFDEPGSAAISRQALNTVPAHNPGK